MGETRGGPQGLPGSAGRRELWCLTVESRILSRLAICRFEKPSSPNTERMSPGTAKPGFLIPVMLCLLAGLGCSAESIVPSIVRDSAGVRIVENRRPVWSTAIVWRIDSGAKFTVGGSGSAPDQLLVFVGGAQRFANGTIVVADGGSKELRFYGTNGALLRRVGANGDGPGEFRDFGGVVASSDTLYVFDPTLQRISWFSKDGQLIGSRQLESTGSAVHSLRMYRLLSTFERTFVLVAQAFPADMKPMPLLHWDSLPTLLYSQEGTLSDTIAEFAGMDIYATPQEAGDIKFARVSSAAADGRLVYMTDGAACP